MDGMRDQIVQKIIHQAMTGHGRQAGKARGHDVHMVVAGAALRAGMAGVQVGVVADVQGDGVERRQARADEFDAVGVVRHGHGDEAAGQSLPVSLPASDWRGCWMWRPSHTDWPITKATSRPIRPNTLKLTHCDSVKCPENATYRLMAPAARKNSAQLRLSLSQA